MATVTGRAEPRDGAGRDLDAHAGRALPRDRAHDRREERPVALHRTQSVAQRSLTSDANTAVRPRPIGQNASSGSPSSVASSSSRVVLHAPSPCGRAAPARCVKSTPSRKPRVLTTGLSGFSSNDGRRRVLRFLDEDLRHFLRVRDDVAAALAPLGDVGEQLDVGGRADGDRRHRHLGLDHLLHEAFVVVGIRAAVRQQHHVLGARARVLAAR